MTMSTLSWPLIETLLSPSSPSDIAGFVVPVVVGAINGELGMRTVAYISQEILKPKPSLANFDTATTVIFICLIAWIVAALKHVLPNVVFRASIGPFSSIPMANVALVFEAPAGMIAIADQWRCGYDAGATAVTTTKPEYISMNVLTNWSDRDQSTKASPGDISWKAHRTAPSVRREVAGRCWAPIRRAS